MTKDSKPGEINTNEAILTGCIIGTVPTATTTRKGIARFATSEEVATGTIGNAIVSPRTLQEKISSLGVDTYEYTQAEASDAWVVEHNLNRYPSVTVVDSAGTLVFASIDYVDKNNCIISFNAPFTGQAYLN